MNKRIDSDLLAEYDFSQGVRGKYVTRLAKGSNVVVLEKDVLKLFPNSAAVNTALRALGKAVEVAQSKKELTRRSKPTSRKRGAV